MAEQVKNVVLVGQGGVGKTLLAEAMLHLSGKTSRLGGHAGTKPTLDYDEQEERRSFSISTAIAPITWKNIRINVLDAPCYPDFIGDAHAAMSVCETALFVVDATEGAQSITTRLWYAAEDLSLSRAIFVNRFDKTETDYQDVLLNLQEHFGNRLGAVTLPWGIGEQFEGIIDVVHMVARKLVDGKAQEMPIPDEYAGMAQAARDSLCDLVAEADDELMLKYLEGETLTQEELESLLHKAIVKRIFVPVFAGSCVREEGVTSLLDDIVEYFPAPSDYGDVPLINGEKINIDPGDDRPVVFIFKSLNDPQMGRLSFIKVLAGTIEPGYELVCARTRKNERLTHLYVMCGRETQDISSAAAGDIVVVPKLDGMTGDTLSVTGKVEVAAFRFPNSLYRIAVEPDKRGTEDKVFGFLEKSCLADPTMMVEHDEETGQTIIFAIGEAQVSVLLERLEQRTGLTAHTVALRIPYRETIRRISSAQGRHKKQTGGAGQYGDCWLRVEPNPDAGYEFIDEVVGGHIPRGFIPAIDKGVQETMREGVLAGYPMIDVKVAVYEGSYHPVDSNEMAFKSAARIAFTKAIEQAEPVLLEPMAHVEVTIPEAFAGSIMGDISASRGRVEGMDMNDRGQTQINATVPLAEIADYATRLRSLSRGTGEFSMSVSGYEQVPHDVQERLAKEYADRRAAGK
ncbi:elongation factor G [Atopobium deltae]|uniref:Putative translation elongation factor G n=1 Tax=Atopobium deltae TaxID=1393034 RepID=A0A133XWR6_9ACTN|nr:elongation factor G [Atopobium deltae]KXB35353.1 putative translation elongation factor G [Atopobium deltae]